MGKPTPHPEVGNVFGRLTVIGEAVSQKRSYYIPVRCSCGIEKLIMKQNLLKGATTSCGCYNKAAVQARCQKYPLGSRDTYLIWFAMVRRCTNPEDASYHNYGGRGIKVCRRWAKFENFLEDMGRAPKGLTLERKKNNLGYTKNNCVWETRTRNLFNRRITVFYFYEGAWRHLGEISEMTGTNYDVLYRRMKGTGKTKEQLQKEGVL